MTTIQARAGDRMDIYAALRSAELTTATLGAWLRANPDLPYALPAGTVVQEPLPGDDAFAYGSSYTPLDTSDLPTAPPKESRALSLDGQLLLMDGQSIELLIRAGRE